LGINSDLIKQAAIRHVDKSTASVSTTHSNKFPSTYSFLLLPNGLALSCGADNYRNATNETSPTSKILSFAPDLCLAMLIAPSWQPSA
jgi:hypothetical protein